jgi:hypothetical protein
MKQIPKQDVEDVAGGRKEPPAGDTPPIITLPMPAGELVEAPAISGGYTPGVGNVPCTDPPIFPMGDFPHIPGLPGSPQLPGVPTDPLVPNF